MVTLHTTIHDGSVPLLPYAFTGNISIHPIRVSPHAGINLAKFDGRACIVGDRLFKVGAEIPIIQEDVRVMKPSVEVSLN